MFLHGYLGRKLKFHLKYSASSRCMRFEHDQSSYFSLLLLVLPLIITNFLKQPLNSLISILLVCRWPTFFAVFFFCSSPPQYLCVPCNGKVEERKCRWKMSILKLWQGVVTKEKNQNSHICIIMQQKIFYARLRNKCHCIYACSIYLLIRNATILPRVFVMYL